MEGSVASEMLTVTLSEAEKRKLRIVAACEGTSMRELVRGWIRTLPAGPVVSVSHAEV
jgi:hypothetical protein